MHLKHIAKNLRMGLIYDNVITWAHSSHSHSFRTDTGRLRRHVNDGMDPLQ